MYKEIHLEEIGNFLIPMAIQAQLQKYIQTLLTEQIPLDGILEMNGKAMLQE